MHISLIPLIYCCSHSSEIELTHSKQENPRAQAFWLVSRGKDSYIDQWKKWIQPHKKFEFVSAFTFPHYMKL